MRSFIVFICWFVATVLAVITGIFGALLIFNKLWNRPVKEESDPSILAEWETFRSTDGHIIKPTLAQYTIVEIREPNKKGEYLQTQKVQEEVQILVWIQDGENIGSSGWEVRNVRQADAWMQEIN